VVLTAVAIGFGSMCAPSATWASCPPTCRPSCCRGAADLGDAAIILPYSATLAVVGLLESLMTAQIVDELTDTESDKNRECVGQGIANIVAGLFGGMAGCAMIGQSVINVKSGGRGRLSTLWPGVFLLFLILVLATWCGRSRWRRWSR
jgi:sulfate permease, SulP family